MGRVTTDPDAGALAPAAVRIVLLVTSPRLPAGLFTAQAWDLLRAHPVLAGAHTPQVEAARAAGADVRVLQTKPSAAPSAEEGSPLGVPAEEGSLVTTIGVRGDPSSGWEGAVLAAAAEHGTVVWLAGPDGDGDFARRLGLRLAREPHLAELELVHGSWDPPGARLLDAVAVIDRLVSPGGDPWKRRQTHASLAPYLLEECYEAYDAIEEGPPQALREELGDLLLQVVLHARLAEERTDGQQWSIDDAAADLVEKMIRRNPHVFADTEVADVDEIIDNWERIKREERRDGSALAGVARSQPALALAAKVRQRVARAGLDVPPPAPPAALLTELPDGGVADERVLGELLLAIVAAAGEAGQDPEAALRRATRAYADRVRAAEGPAAEATADGDSADSADSADNVDSADGEPQEPE